MNVSEITSRVKFQFGDESGVQIDDSKIIRWLNDGLREFAYQNRLFQAKATVPIVVGTKAYVLPPNLLRLHAVKVDFVPIKEMSVIEVDEYISQADGTTSTGSAQVYWMYGDEINLYPIPDSVQTLQIYYSKVPDELAATTDVIPVPEEYRTRLVEYCLTQAYEMDENFKAAQIKGEQFRSGLNDMRDAQQSIRDSTYPQINYISDMDLTDAW